MVQILKIGGLREIESTEGSDGDFFPRGATHLSFSPEEARRGFVAPDDLDPATDNEDLQELYIVFYGTFEPPPGRERRPHVLLSEVLRRTVGTHKLRLPLVGRLGSQPTLIFEGKDGGLAYQFPNDDSFSGLSGIESLWFHYEPFWVVCQA